MNGFKLAKTIRGSADSIKDTPIIGITPATEPEYAKKAKEAGMNTLLMKPIHQQQLKDLIHDFNHAPNET